MKHHPADLCYDSLLDFLFETGHLPSDGVELGAFCDRLYCLICKGMRDLESLHREAFRELLCKEVLRERSKIVERAKPSRN